MPTSTQHVTSRRRVASTQRGVRARRALHLVVMAAMLAACSGDASPAITPATSTPATGTGTGATPTETPTGVGTTSEPAPELAPTGTVWTDTPAIPDRTGLRTRAVRDIDGTRWIVGSEHNAILLARSTDGQTWEEIRLEEPDRQARAGFEILAGTDGRLIVIGNRLTDCQTAQPIDGRFFLTGMCRDSSGTIHISDDGGDTWRRVDPAVMDPSGRASFSFAGAVATQEGFAVAATVRDTDWRTELYQSPDGETWTRAARIDGTNGPVSAVSLHHDGQVYVLHVEEHACPSIHFTTPGWILGATWTQHGRFYEGSSLDNLTLHTPATLPIAADSAEIDCATFDVFNHDIEYPTWTVGAADGTITVLDITRPDGNSAPETYPIARRIDGAWTAGELPSLAASTGSTGVLAGGIAVVDHPAGAAVVEVLNLGAGSRNGYRLGITPIDDAEAAVVSETVFDDPTIIGSSVDGDRLELASFVFAQRGAAVNFLRSEPSAPGQQTCFPGPGANCLGAVLAAVVEDGDLAGADLRGIRLRYADLTGIDFTGANLSGADLRNTTGTGIRWEGADISDALFTSTNLSVEGWPHDVTGASVDNTTLQVSWPADAGDDWTMTLEGIRLLSAGTVRGAERPLPVSSIVGMEFSSGTFANVDLSNADVTGIDFTWIRFDEASICPDGSSPSERDHGLRCP